MDNKQVENLVEKSVEKFIKNRLSPLHRHGGGFGDGNKIPSSNIDKLEGFFVQNFSHNGTSGMAAANLYTSNTFSPRYMEVIVACRSANAGGGVSKMKVVRADVAGAFSPEIRSLNYDGSADVYAAASNNLTLTDTAGNTFTFSLIELTESGYTLNWAAGGINMDVVVDITLYGYSKRYNNILLNKLF